MRNMLDIIERVHPDHKLRETAKKAHKKIQDFYINDIDTNAALYQALQEYIDHRMAQEALTEQQHYVLNASINRFKKLSLTCLQLHYLFPLS